MQTRQFERFLKRISELTLRQRTRLLALLLPAERMDRVIALIEHVDSGTHACPRCGSHASYRHGQANGLQRYRCRRCGRTFNALSGTPLARLRLKTHWLDYLERMLDSRSVRRSASDLGVASTTTFRWRHRFLTRTRDDRPAQLGGITEVENSTEGTITIRGFSCPLDAVVHDHPELCNAVEAMLTEMIGSPVREHCQRGSSSAERAAGRVP